VTEEKTVTVGELRAALAKLDSDLNVIIALNGSFVPVTGLTPAATGTNFVVIRGKGKLVGPRKFSVDEEGVLGHLARLGLGDDEIAEVLGRPPASIRQRRKALGF
jgi:hypothetical protein